LESASFVADELPIADLLDEGAPSFGFSWEIADEALPHHAGYPPASAYHPFQGSIGSSALRDFDPLANAQANLNPDFKRESEQSPPSDRLLVSSAFLPDPDAPSSMPESYDLSVFQLPKQELTSVSQLRWAYESDWLDTGLGEPGSPLNAWFDDFFFSTIPQEADGESPWIPPMPLPNSGYVPADDSIDAAQLRGSESASKLYVEGMFNVHSTSIESWEALLKSAPVDEGGRYLLFNYPLGGEDLYRQGLVPGEGEWSEVDAFRASMGQSVIAVSEEDLAVLAKRIVANIRMKVQGIGGYPAGAFATLEEFVNSGVLDNAIAEAALELDGGGTAAGGNAFRPAWALPGTPREFSQSTILNLIGPYLSVRSDTFLIRAYGDAVNPSDPDDLWARAYCEAIVQRTHQEHGEEAYGRRFELIAFRWLSPSEI